MNIEDKILLKYLPDFEKLIKYGFKEEKNQLIIEKLFNYNQFKAIITIDFNGKIAGTVYDLENDDEFLPLRVSANKGIFVGKIRLAYENLLKDIRDNCFTKEYYIFPQSNRITNLIIKKYGNTPEFLWDKFKGTGIFRNPETKKWYAAIMNIDRSKIQPKKQGLIEIILIKLSPENVKKITQQEHFYEGYHMNKKHWITIILDDSINDNKIMELIDESHSFTEKKTKFK